MANVLRTARSLKRILSSNEALEIIKGFLAPANRRTLLNVVLVTVLVLATALTAIIVIRRQEPRQTVAVTEAIYVSPSGEDANPGTATLPLKTIEQARDIVRAKQQQRMKSDFTVYLYGGTYTLDSTLVFDQRDSGKNGHNIIYRNVDGQTPIISGGRQITGWQANEDPSKPGSWKAYVGQDLLTRQLYVNGRRAVRARSKATPNLELLRTKAASSGNSNPPYGVGYTVTQPGPVLEQWNNQHDIEVVSRVNWALERCGVESIVGAIITMKQPCWNNTPNDESFMLPPTPTWIENAYELLQDPGEWYLNRQTGWMYYMPYPTDAMTAATVIAPTLEQLVDIEGSADRSVHNIQLSGLTFAYGTWLDPSTDNGHPDLGFNIAGPGEGPWKKILGNVNVNFAHDIGFSRNTFIHLGGAALNLEPAVQHITITGNHLTDISGNGIEAGDVYALWTKGTGIASQPSSIHIKNNYIHNIGVEYTGAVGIFVTHTKNSTISHNELTDLPYTGISLSYGLGWQEPNFAVNNSIDHNFIHDYMTLQFDGAGIYTQGRSRNSTISDNVIQDEYNYALHTGSSEGNGGIYLDQGSGNYVIEKNVVFKNRRSLLVNVAPSATAPDRTGSRRRNDVPTFVVGGEIAIRNNWWDIPDPGTSVWFYDGKPPPGKPGAIKTLKVASNHAITSRSGAPASIIANAGLEGPFLGIRRLPSCIADNSCRTIMASGGPGQPPANAP